VVAGPVVPADEFIEVAHVARQAPAERAAQQLKRPEAGGPHAVIIEGQLVVLAEVERLIQLPYVGPVELGCAVAGAIRQEDDVAPRPWRGIVNVTAERSPALQCIVCHRHLAHPLVEDQGRLTPQADVRK
jgi:hypothetical protein